MVEEVKKVYSYKKHVHVLHLVLTTTIQQLTTPATALWNHSGTNSIIEQVQLNSTQLDSILYRKSCSITKESDELHHSIGSLVDRAHPGPKTDGDYLGRYCP